MQCYSCGMFGHVARSCPNKGKGKGKAGYGKGGKGGKGGKDGGKGFGGKGNGMFGGKGGKGGGYQGVCWSCGKRGHKAAEFWAAQAVDWGTREEEGVADEEGEECGGVWMIGNVEASSVGRKEAEWKITRRRRKAKSERTKSAYLNGPNPSGDCSWPEGRGKHSRGSEDVAGPSRRVGGRWNALLEDDGGVEEVDVGAVDESLPQDEITIDSGAGKNVWPNTRKEGGKVRQLEKRIRLSAANGNEMKVEGEKMVRFKADGKECGMNFIVTEVKKPLAAVSAIVDEGNIVVFGPGPHGSFIQNCMTGEKIMMQRKKGTYVIKVDISVAKKVGRSVRSEEVGVDASAGQEVERKPCSGTSGFTWQAKI